MPFVTGRSFVPIFTVHVLLAGISSAFCDWSVMHVLTSKCLVD